MKFVSLVLTVAFLFTACNTSIDKQETKQYEKAKQSMADAEKSYPLTFLKIEGTSKRNFIGQTVVKADVTNLATVVKYTNIRIKAVYYNRDALVTNHEDVIDKVINPGEVYHFKSKYFTPKGTDKVLFSIMSADVAEAEKP